jgi:hypothetical protein
MVETARVISLDTYRKTGADSPGEFSASYRQIIDEDKVSSRSTDVADLYSADTESARLVMQARRLLSESDARIQAAKQLLADEDKLGADSEITHFQADLPELFCCHSLSEGFASLILSLHYGLKNRAGQPLNEDQIFSVEQSVKALHDNPFLPFEEALYFADKLEETGLKINPPEAEILGDFFIR